VAILVAKFVSLTFCVGVDFCVVGPVPLVGISSTGGFGAALADGVHLLVMSVLFGHGILMTYRLLPHGIVNSIARIEHLRLSIGAGIALDRSSVHGRLAKVLLGLHVL
jgi:hypothetical protein